MLFDFLGIKVDCLGTKVECLGTKVECLFMMGQSV